MQSIDQHHFQSGQALHVLLLEVTLPVAGYQGQPLDYHPETDGQTEWVNQILEQYLWVYINYQQDNWVNLLPLDKFAYNNTSHSVTMVTPFFANKGFHPKLKVSLGSVVSDTFHQVGIDLKELHQYFHDQISCALKQYKVHSVS